MRMSSTTTTRIGRRSESGRCTRSLVIGLLAGWLSIALGAAVSAGESVELSEGQVHAAKIRAWLDRNPAITQEALHSLYFGLDAEARLAAYEALRQRLEKELRRKLEADPEAFAEKCNAFFSDLTAGALDYPVRRQNEWDR